MDPESGSSSHGSAQEGLQLTKKASTAVLLTLAYQSFGVVYGDLSVSPLYVFRATFGGRLRNDVEEYEVMAVLSFIFWTLTIIPVVKYSFIVLCAHDNGEGGTFALYALLCRHLKLSLILNQQAADEELSAYKFEQPSSPRGVWFRRLLDRHKSLRNGLLIVVLLGTCMVIGDGALTPALSVLSAISGIRVAAPSLHENVTVAVACCILILLFWLQHIGTRRVSFLFAPIILAWLLCNSAIGLYNLITWNPRILKALSPYYMYYFFKMDGKEGWVALGGVLLCITGAEAMYADLGHFSRKSVKIAFTGVVYPSLVIGYIGQAAYLSKHLDEVEHAYFRSVPGPVFWPVFIIATLASIVGSQAVISATFSIINQCMALGCFPRVKVVHTSNHIYGQIYIPEINWIMLILCLALTIGFRNTIDIGNAYGIAVIIVMLVTTCLMTLVIVTVWQRSIFFAVLFFVVFGSVELLYLSTAFFKVPKGGWVPLVLAGVFMSIMYVWNYGTTKKYEFDFQNKISMKWLLNLGPGLGIVRVPGMGLIYTDLVSGVPAIFSHFVTNLPAFHEVLVFVCMKSAPVPYVSNQERYLVGRIGPRDYHMYRCVIRYGYKDVRRDEDDFENQLIANLAEFIQTEEAESSNEQSFEGDRHLAVMGTTPGLLVGSNHSARRVGSEEQDSIKSVAHSNNGSSLQSMEWLSSSPGLIHKRRVQFDIPTSETDDDSDVRKELAVLSKAKEAGIAYMMSHSYVKAKKSSSYLKKFAIDYLYTFLRKNSRDPAIVLNIPHTSLIEVGMFYYV
jgi:KUP system potassium uptake protein